MISHLPRGLADASWAQSGCTRTASTRIWSRAADGSRHRGRPGPVPVNPRGPYYFTKPEAKRSWQSCCRKPSPQQ